MNDEFKTLAMLEADRVAALIERDKADRARDRERANARTEMENGSFASIEKTVMEPTPEWLEKGDFRSYTPKQIDNTIRTTKTVRRISLPRVLMMHQAGNLSEDHLSACIWYRKQWEEAGLQGRVKSSHLSLTGNTGGGSGGMGQAPMPLHEREAIARQMYRGARDAITPFYIRFFEAVVLRDVPLRRAARFARCRAERVPLRFRDCCNQIYDFMDKNGVDEKKDGDEG